MKSDFSIIIEYAEIRLSESQQLLISDSETQLSIEWNSQQFPFYLFQNLTKKLRVEIPVSMAKNLKSFTCSNATGDIDVSQINATSIELKSGLGTITTSNLESESISIKTGSGRIYMDTLVCDTLAFSTTTGDVTGISMHVKDTEAHTTSGDITIAGNITNSLEIQSISGAMLITAEQCPKITDLQSVRGSIELNMPPSLWDDGFELEYYIGYGSLELPNTKMDTDEKNGTIVYGSGTHKINLTTTNGKMMLMLSGLTVYQSA